jgi:hypothetical protein
MVGAALEIRTDLASPARLRALAPGAEPEAGVATPPIADWFHIVMRLQPAKQAASSLSTDESRRIEAKTAIVAEVERLHWRI